MDRLAEHVHFFIKLFCFFIAKKLRFEQTFARASFAATFFHDMCDMRRISTRRKTRPKYSLILHVRCVHRVDFPWGTKIGKRMEKQKERKVPMVRLGVARGARCKTKEAWLQH